MFKNVNDECTNQNEVLIELQSIHRFSIVICIASTEYDESYENFFVISRDKVICNVSQLCQYIVKLISFEKYDLIIGLTPYLAGGKTLEHWLSTKSM
jgi:hypothetical protein